MVKLGLDCTMISFNVYSQIKKMGYPLIKNRRQFVLVAFNWLPHAFLCFFLIVVSLPMEEIRRPLVDCSAIESSDYDNSLHIWAMFIILAASLIGVSMPYMLSAVMKKNFDYFISVLKCFGAGVIISTAIIHIFLPSVEIFGNECLPEELKGYGAFAGAFCLIGILISLTVQQIAQGHSYDSSGLPRFDDDDKVIETTKVDVFMIESGVAVHSIVVGIAFGLSSEEFVPLLIALCFHQFFEGIALSSIVYQCQKQKKGLNLMLYTIYGLSTPVGVLIGILIHQKYSENNPTSLAIQGIAEAVSSGILLYDGLVNVIGNHFKSGSFVTRSHSKQVVQLVALWFGTCVMSIIGHWA